MSKLAIYMKSGNSFEVDVKNWKVTTTPHDRSFQWSDTETGKSLLLLVMDEVEAIVEVKK